MVYIMCKINNLTIFVFIFCVHRIITAQVIDNTNRISRQKCKEYGQSASSAEASCRLDKNSLNLSGVIVKDGEFPHMAVLGYEVQGEIVWKCSGVLVSDQFVLVTAFCTHFKSTGPVVKVRFGTLNFEKNGTNTQEVKVSQIIQHPEYKKEKYNDIALLKLEHPVKFNSYVRPACLPKLNQKLAKTYILTGFEIFTAEKRTYLTDYKNVKEVLHEECNGYYDKIRSLPHGIDIDTHFCAGPHDVVCPFLSGAPLQTYDEEIQCMYDVHAIISFGKPCGTNAPTIFTKVAPYIDWIEEKVWQ